MQSETFHIEQLITAAEVLRDDIVALHLRSAYPLDVLLTIVRFKIEEARVKLAEIENEHYKTSMTPAEADARRQTIGLQALNAALKKPFEVPQ